MNLQQDCVGGFFVCQHLTIVNDLYIMNINESIQDWINNNCDTQQAINLLSIVEPGHRWEKFKGISFIPFNEKQQLKKKLLSFRHVTLQSQKIDTKKNEIDNLTEKFEVGKLEGSFSVQPFTPPPPESILLMKKKRGDLLSIYRRTHGQLSIATEQKTRYNLAKEIMEDIIPELDRISGIIRHWEETGEEPEVAKLDIVQDTVKKAKKIGSLTPMISRLNKKIEKATSLDEKLRFEKELLEKEEELQQIKDELGW